jgi:uncharacterized protein (DUF58 family)
MTRPFALLVTAACLAALAGALPSPALLPAAIALAAVTGGALALTAIAARRIEVTRTVARREAPEGAAIRVELAVRGARRLPVEIEARDGDGEWRPASFVEIAIPRRGAYVLAPSALRVRDRLGIASRRLSAGAPEPLLILPVPDVAAARVLALGASAGDPEPDGLEAYVPGIPISRIHWPSLARGGGLHARRIAAAPHELPLVVVDTSRAPAAAVDWAARAAAGHVLRLARGGGCRVLLPGDREATTVADPAAWRAVHRRLALLAPAPPTPAPLGALRVAAAGAAAAPSPPLPFGVEAAP